MQVDLNLLVALDALLEERSVQGAADRMHLSAPAMSRTLTRIRRATGDEILVRTGRTMTATPRAIELQAETRELVQRAVALLTPARTLDLATLRRTFSIRGHDALIGALAAALTDEVAAAGPDLALRFLAESAGDSTDLAHGRVDLEVGAAVHQPPEIAVETVGSDRMVAVFRAGHELAGGPLTAEGFAAGAHVAVSRRGRRHGAIDEALAALGLQRRVLAVLPTAAAALDLVARSDCVTVVPERLCAARPTAARLSTSPLPFALPPVPVVLTWHHRSDRDVAHAWLRTRTSEALARVLRDGSAPPVEPEQPPERRASDRRRRCHADTVPTGRDTGPFGRQEQP